MIQVSETGPLHETRRAISEALLLGALRQDELIEAAELANAQLRTEIVEHRQREIDAKLLASEVSHRVKNNLQVIAALIANEIKRTPEPWVQGYRATQDRIIAIAQLYDLISQTSRHRTVALEAYLRELSKSLTGSLLEGAAGIRISVEAEEDLQVDSERAVPFGLLVNELATNAVKHAFPGGTGLVTIAVRRIGTEIELMITDDGIGMAARGQASTPGKHGSDYVAIFVRQLRGAHVRSSEPGSGTTVSIRFPLSTEPWH
jgi:two-component sensor histidine kinase